MNGKKIIVIGSSGSGKSYISKQIHLITNIPLYHMDMIWHKENWTHITREELIEILNDIMKNEEWIIDGFYSKTLKMRFEKAETVVFLDIPVEECIANESKRRGTKRDDLPSFLVEEDDPLFAETIKQFPTTKRPLILELMKEYPNKEYIILKNRAEEEAFLEKLSLKA